MVSLSKYDDDMLSDVGFKLFRRTLLYWSGGLYYERNDNSLVSDSTFKLSRRTLSYWSGVPNYDRKARSFYINGVPKSGSRLKLDVETLLWNRRQWYSFWQYLLSACSGELYHIDYEYPTMKEKLEAFTSMGFQNQVWD